MHRHTDRHGYPWSDIQKDRLTDIDAGELNNTPQKVVKYGVVWRGKNQNIIS